MTDKNEITVKLKVSGSIKIPDEILEKIADGLGWIEEIVSNLNVSVQDILDDAPVDLKKTAAAYADAARQRQSQHETGPEPAFDFGSLIGLCEKSTDDVQDQGRLNADRIGLAIAGISAFGVGKTPSDTDIAKYRDAVRRYSETLGQIASKTRKLH
ncbi:hypothetical protein IQ03_03475 [Gemmobacter caeni]|uniref:Uncharacterized protein n=1 Tax=Gemmobacter caeni TaxID=589035 RepID=A0A2T6AT87_9RHOB|nr:hypothetical protein [Gemmobacter caeni]PTX47028.1 hypothetical protein C8N34_11448 [Gemmobacter caeni]TWI96115.1 hypothetical protein IQ03_03475 [Gemmobacter caeni]